MEHVKRVDSNILYAFPKRMMVALCLAIIISSVLSFVYNGIIRGLDIPGDFYVFYTAGSMWNAELDVYDQHLFDRQLSQIVGESPRFPTEYAYPPQGTALFALFARLPLEQAHLVFQVLSTLLVVISLLLLALILAQYRAIGLLEVTLLASFLNTGFARMGVREGQVSLIVCALLLVSFLLATRQQKVGVGIVLGAVSFKPTFLPLYIGYFLLRRSFRLVLAFGFAAGVFTVLPLILAQRPVVGTIEGWMQQLLLFQNAQGSNDISPFFPYSAFILNIKILVYRVLNAESLLTTVVAWLIVLLVCGYAAYLMLRSQPSPKSMLLDFGLVSALSLVSFYHRSYDIFLLFPGILYLYIHSMNSRDTMAQQKWGSFIVILLVILALPVDVILRLSYTNPALLDSYLWRVVTPVHAWASVAVVGVLLWMKIGQVAGNRTPA